MEKTSLEPTLPTLDTFHDMSPVELNSPAKIHEAPYRQDTSSANALVIPTRAWVASLTSTSANTEEYIAECVHSASTPTTMVLTATLTAKACTTVTAPAP